MPQIPTLPPKCPSSGLTFHFVQALLVKQALLVNQFKTKKRLDRYNVTNFLLSLVLNQHLNMFFILIWYFLLFSSNLLQGVSLTFNLGVVELISSTSFLSPRKRFLVKNHTK